MVEFSKSSTEQSSADVAAICQNCRKRTFVAMSATANWEEVKRLAADFQKAQLSSTLQRLSDRNCVEIVTKLIELNLLNVIFTTDGKEYLTPQQLTREIKDELYLRGGRVNLVDLAKELNVEFSQVSSRVNDVCQSSSNVNFVLGQLIDDTYITRIATEINEKLNQNGQINVSELTLVYDLPAEFLLHSVLEKKLGKIIFGQQDPVDPRIFFTTAFVARTKAKIKGSLTGLTRPVPVNAILNQCNITERLFFSFMKEISSIGSVTSKQASAQYIPHVYSKSQVDWVINSYKQSGYLKYDSLERMGISDAKQFIKRTLPNEDITYFQACAIGNQILEQIVIAIEECNSSKSYVDVMSLLPSFISEQDVENLIAKAMVPTLQKYLMVYGSTVVSTQFIEKLAVPCYALVNEKAQEFVKSGGYQRMCTERQLSNVKSVEVDLPVHVDVKAERREERRRKAAGGKGGGGTQGRETKTKSVKKHSRTNKGGHDSDSDDASYISSKKSNQASVDLLSVKEIKKCLSPTLDEEGIDYISSYVAEYLFPLVNKAGLATAQSLYEATIENTSQVRRQTHSSLQDKLNISINDIRHYEKGIKMFPADQQPQFIKYLLKSLGGDIASDFYKYIGNECGLAEAPDTLTLEQRNKMVNDVTDEYKGVLSALNKSLTGQSIETFLQAAENCLEACSMILKKIDKKKDRSLILTHKHGLLEQVDSCDDPPLLLHLSVLTIFTIATQTMLHASGRQVSTIITLLKPYLTDDQKKELFSFQDLVLELLNLEDEDSKRNDVVKQLEEKMPALKKLTVEFKKPSVQFNQTTDA